MMMTINRFILGFTVLISCTIIQAQETIEKQQNNGYSEIIINNFTKACTNAGAELTYCSCMIDNVSKNLTQAEYIQEEMAFVKTGRISDKFSEIMSSSINACSKSQ